MPYDKQQTTPLISKRQDIRQGKKTKQKEEPREMTCILNKLQP
jgi:hypothetical protein